MKNTFFLLLAVAFLGACGPNPVGRPCTTTADCSPSFTCFTDLKGGYCTRGCSIEGGIDQCPGGTVCAPIAANAMVCTPICTDDAQCDNVNLTCGAVNGFTQKACRTP